MCTTFWLGSLANTRKIGESKVPKMANLMILPSISNAKSLLCFFNIRRDSVKRDQFSLAFVDIINPWRLGDRLSII